MSDITGDSAKPSAGIKPTTPNDDVSRPAGSLISIFPTTLFHRRLDGMEETNAQLTSLIAAIERSEPNRSLGTTTEGGYQTELDIFHRNEPTIAHLKKHVTDAVRDYAGIFIQQERASAPASVEFALWGWGVSLRAGHSQGQHVHPNAHVSGVYYVSIPAAVQAQGKDGGKIFFYDPRTRANMNQIPHQLTRFQFTPTAGDLILFPSSLEHSVSAFNGPGKRICIAFNARLVIK